MDVVIIWLFLQQLLLEPKNSVCREWKLLCYEIEQANAQGPDICLPSINLFFASQHDLGGVIPSWTNCALGLLVLAYDGWDAEVCEHCLSFAVDHYVLRLYISVAYIVFVALQQCWDDLPHPVSELLWFKRLFFKSFLKVATLHQIHNEEEFVHFGVVYHLNKLDDVGVV